MIGDNGKDCKQNLMNLAVLKNINKRYSSKNYFFAPECIVLGVNNVCNLHCKMCDVGTKNMDSNFAQNLIGTHPLNMPLELTKKIIDQTKLYYPSAKIAYAFTEPLVYPSLVEAVAYTTEKGLHSSVTTNALTLKNKADALVEAGLKEIFISLDGPQEIHNEIRGHKKSFQKAIEGIKALKQHKNCPRISVICAITEWNIGHLSEMIGSLSGLGIDEIGFMHTQFITENMSKIHNESVWGDLYPVESSNVDIIDFTKMNLEVLLEEIEHIKNSTYEEHIYFSPEIRELSDLKTYYLSPETIMGKGCHAVFTNIMIKSDGSVIPAHGRCYNLTIGNINDSDLKTIWSSTILKNLRTNLSKSKGLLPACSRCCSGVSI